MEGNYQTKFSDNIVLLANATKELQTMIERLEKKCVTAGLLMKA